MAATTESDRLRTVLAAATEEAELASSRAARPGPAPRTEAMSRLATPESGRGLWLARAVALGLVTALLAAVVLLLAGVL